MINRYSSKLYETSTPKIKPGTQQHIRPERDRKKEPRGGDAGRRGAVMRLAHACPKLVGTFILPHRQPN
jgi:hypothetical protein